MSYALKFSIPHLPKIGMNARWHWRKRHRDTVEWDALIAAYTCGKRPPAPLQKVSLVLSRHSSVCPDYDGLVHSFKNVIDGLVSCGVLLDDSMKITGVWDCRWIEAPPKHGFITVEIYGKE